jgi:hypothetical protein
MLRDGWKRRRQQGLPISVTRYYSMLIDLVALQREANDRIFDDTAAGLPFFGTRTMPASIAA